MQSPAPVNPTVPNESSHFDRNRTALVICRTGRTRRLLDAYARTRRRSIHAITHYSRCALLQKLVCGDVPAGELYTANALQSPAAAR